MQIEQAIYTSADTGSMQGYQLVSRSAGIDRRLAAELCRWAPSHASLLSTDEDEWSISYYLAGDGWAAISRSLHGGPEYSSRGGMQVVTLILALPADQLEDYDCSPLALARTALALGYLRLQPPTAGPLPALSLPKRPLPNAGMKLAGPHAGDEAGRGALDRCGTTLRNPERLDPRLRQAIDLLRGNNRVAVFGLPDRLEACDLVLRHLPPAQRLGISFTTGLKPSVRRTFRLQFFPQESVSLRRSLSGQGISCVPTAN